MAGVSMTARGGCASRRRATPVGVAAPWSASESRYRERDTESSREVGEVVRSPTVTQGDRDSDRLRILANRQVSDIADKLEEAVLRVELVEQEGEERSRPTECRRTLGEETKDAGAERSAPALEVSLVLPPQRF